MEGVILAWINPAGEFEQDGEKPRAVSIEMLAVHDHHVVDVFAASVHKYIPLQQILRF